MKNRWMCLAAILIPCLASADVAVGVNFATDLHNESHKVTAGNIETDNRSSGFGIKVIPSLIIVPDSRIEIVPNVGFSFGHYATENRFNDSVINESSNNTVGFGAGCGLFFRAIDASVLRFSIGPDLQFWYTDPDGDENYLIDASIGLPANIDLIFSNRFFARISSRLFRSGVVYSRNSDTDHTTAVTFFDIKTILSPSLGFYFSF
jgi:hypothetical protein